MASAAGESSSASAATTTATQAQYDVKVDTDKQGKHGPIVKSSRATAGSSRVSFLSRRFRHRTCKSNHRAPLQRNPLPTIFEDAPAIVDATVSSPVSLGLFPASFHLCRVRHCTHKSNPPANLPNTLLPTIFDETPTPALFSTADKDHNPHLLSHHQVSIAHDPQQTSGLSFIHQQHANIMKLRQDHANFQQQLKEIYQAHNDAMIAIFTNAFSAHSLPLPSFRSLPSTSSNNSNSLPCSLASPLDFQPVPSTSSTTQFDHPGMPPPINPSNAASTSCVSSPYPLAPPLVLKPVLPTPLQSNCSASDSRQCSLAPPSASKPASSTSLTSHNHQTKPLPLTTSIATTPMSCDAIPPLFLSATPPSFASPSFLPLPPPSPNITAQFPLASYPLPPFLSLFMPLPLLLLFSTLCSRSLPCLLFPYDFFPDHPG